ncbi:MAG TPA: maleylpyruvate isomerase N-terminal domain-containing protein [Vicinamibacterales bacterium]
MTTLPPCYTSHLFRPLAAELVQLLRSLSADDWQRPTVAPQWQVRDVGAHLLDVTLRRIAVNRDRHLAPVGRPPSNERELTAFINALNAGGVSFAARLSPRLITDLIEVTTSWLADVIEAMPPHDAAVFAVSWAGQSASHNWMDTGREYTEHWHHQMQIREATSRPRLLLEPRWMEPLLDISVRALPHAYRDVAAAAGAAITLIVDGPTSGTWTLTRDEVEWRISAGESDAAKAVVRVAADTVWRILYNAPFDHGQVRIEGDAALAAPLLATRSVIV